ncbi:MAG: asparagine synthase, partial [Synechococcaceae bacterium WB9_4xB_025]|nr:asparagine synthase [Synechococcaceae bacterium WB9_4xB_025]
LPNDILVKMDRAAMAASLETRAPFLDHRVAELAWQLPLSLKLRDGMGKWALRQLLDRHAPRALIDRPKAGFAIPIGPWLRGPLRSWAEDLLDPALIRRQGWLEPEPLQRLWREHLAGADHTPQLWTVLMWQAWCDHWLP